MNPSHTRTSFKEIVTPKRYNPKAKEICFFTISVGTKNQSIEEISAAYLWAKRKYIIKSLLIGDSLYRITLQIREGLTEEEANEKSAQISEKLISDFQNLTHEKTPVSIKRTSNIIECVDFDKAYAEIESLYKVNNSFKDAVDADAQRYISRQRARKNLRVTPDEGLDLSISYLKQEIAVYLLLAEQGWLVDLYLGQEIPTLAKIMEGELPVAPEGLKRRVNIELRRQIERKEFKQKTGARAPFWQSALTRLRKLVRRSAF